MTEIVPVIVAVVGTLLGGALAFVAQSRVSANQIAEARYDRRREDFVSAASGLAAAITKLLQAEYNRAKLRIENEPEEQRAQARLATYDRRSDAQLAQFRFQIISDPAVDRALVESADNVIELCKQLTNSTPTIGALASQHRAAKEALRELIEAANERANDLYSRRSGARSRVRGRV